MNITKIKLMSSGNSHNMKKSDNDYPVRNIIITFIVYN